jgi:WD40 repeat protein
MRQIGRKLLGGVTLACLGVLLAWGSVLAGGDKLPTVAEVKDLESKYQAERDELVKSGGDKRFLPQLLQKAEQFAKSGAAALKGGRLLQANSAFRQARWQLPYQGPEVPDHVYRILGALRLRHSGAIRAVAYSPDGKRLATGSADRTVKLWDMANGHEALRYVGHGDVVRTLAFRPDGKMIASAGGDDYIKLWDPATGQDIRTLKPEGAGSPYVTYVTFSPDGKYLVSAWSDKAVRIHDVATGTVKRTMQDFQQMINAAVFSPDGKVLGAAVGDGQLRLWEYPKIVDNPIQPEFWSQNDQQGASYHIAFSPDGSRLARCFLNGIKVYETPQPGRPGNANYVVRTIPQPPPENPTTQILFTCSLFSKDGKTLFTGASDGTIRLYDMEQGNLVGTFKGHNDSIFALAFNPTGTELASASQDHTVRVWPFEVVSQSREFVGHEAPVWTAAFSPDGMRLVSSSSDQALKVWEVGTGQAVFTLTGHKGGTTAAQFSPNGKRIVSGAGDMLLKLWDADTGKWIQDLEGHRGTVTALDYSRDGKAIVSGGVDQLIKVWDADKGKELVNIDGAHSVVTAVAFHPDGKQIVSAHVDGSIRLWDAATGKAGAYWIAHGASVTAVAFSNDGQKLASCGNDQMVKVWSLATPGVNPIIFSGHTGPLSSVAFRPDDRYVVSAGADQVIKLWKLADGSTKEAAKDFRGHKDWVTSVAFSKDGYYVTSASVDKTVRLWEITSREVPLLSEHTGAVLAVNVSADGKYLASGGTDRTIKIWDLATGTEVKTLRGPQGEVVALAFTPDAKTLVSSSSPPHDIHLWDVTAGAQLPEKDSYKQNLRNFLGAVRTVAVSSDGKRLLIWAPGDTRYTMVHVVDPTTGDKILEGRDLNRDVKAVAFTGDGGKAALGAADGSVRVYTLDKQMTIAPGGDWFLFDNDVSVTSLAFGPDGNQLVAGSSKGEAKICTAAPRKILHTLKGHTGKIRTCAISPNGKLCATSGDDNVIKLWDLANGQELRSWSIRVPEQINRSFVAQLTFTPDSRKLISANANTTIYVLDCP